MPSAIPIFRSHLPLLDGIRGLAILLVMVFHMSLLSDRGGVDSFARSVLSGGWCGVDLFFVLSGFLITGILYDTKANNAYFKTFYARRALRIFPLYYAVVFVSLIVLPAVAAHLPEKAQGKLTRFGTIEGDEWMYWTYLSNFAIAQAGKFRHGILDISWSLAIEEQFYLVWPAIVFLFSRKSLLRICVGAIGFSLAFRCWLLYTGVNPVALHVLTPSRLDALAVGAFIALAVRHEGGLDRLAAVARVVIPVFGLALLGDFVFRYVTKSGRKGEEGLFSANLPEIQTVGLTVIAVFFGAILVRAVAASQRELTAPDAYRSRLVRIFESPLLRSFGKYSYAMYLFHLPLRALVRDSVLANKPPPLTGKQLPLLYGTELPAQIAFTVVCIAITYIAAWLSWNLYEKHWLAFKRYVDYK
ncbi:MAG: acyltransferase [Phycisphaeraceae bacterium]|nr:acyltransferase [Phycisphaeraceae bacterium]